jgi:hypothetical protein
VAYSARVIAQTKMLERLLPDPSHERDQKQKGGE